MIEFLVEVVGEFLIQLLLEVLAETGLRSLAEPFRKTPDPWFAAVGYALFGAAAGAASLLVWPSHLTPHGALRVLNLLLAPLAAGGCMAALGALRARRGESLIRIDKFWCGYLFALTLAAVRFKFAA